jgi:arylamine N-acetyltransferase
MPRPIYTETQLGQFYDRIQLPQECRFHKKNVSELTRDEDWLAFLTVLQRHTLCAIPFENLSLHYSRSPNVDLHPTSLFRKIVHPNHRRGGYCMENNTLFATILRTIGFKVISTAGRVSSQAAPNGDVTGVTGPPMFYGFSHMVNIVTIGSVRYLVDVGFGAGCAIRPVPLIDGHVQSNLPPHQSVRLRWDTIEENEDPEAKLWILERRDSTSDPWSAVVCFPDRIEYLPSDFEVLNLFTSTSRACFFTHTVVVVKYLLSEDLEKVVGKIVLLGNRLHWRVGGRKDILGVLANESDRVDALEKFFDIRLSEMQQSAILGLGSMLGEP